MCYVNGKQVDSIMDDEAIDIYWGYVDKYFYSDLSEDDMFVKIYKDTADKIMTRTTTGADIANKFILLLIIVTVIIGVVVIIALVRKSQREKAEETERILNTPVEKIRDESLKDLENKYK